MWEGSDRLSICREGKEEGGSGQTFWDITEMLKSDGRVREGVGGK